MNCLIEETETHILFKTSININKTYIDYLINQTYIVRLFLLLSSLFGGRGIRRSSGSTSSSDGTTSRDRGHLLLTFGNELNVLGSVLLSHYALVCNYLVNILFLKGSDQRGQTFLLGFNTNGGHEGLDIGSGRGGLTTGNKKKVGCEILHDQ
jgi:hypothetical protein